jgi:hypothetical protein
MPRSEERGGVVSNTVALQVVLAFSLEETPCGSTGLLHWVHWFLRRRVVMKT